MVKIAGNTPPLLYDALKAEGFILPPECADVQLLTPIDGTFQMQFTVNLTVEQLGQVGRALARMSRDQSDV